MEFFSVFSKFTYKWTPQTNLAPLARPFRGRKHHFFPIIAVFQDFQTIQRLQNYLRGCPSISFNIATFLYIDSTTMSVWRPLFIKCIILDHKLQRTLNDSKIAQLNSERPSHQTAVLCNHHHIASEFKDLLCHHHLLVVLWLLLLLKGQEAPMINCGNHDKGLSQTSLLASHSVVLWICF